MKRFETLLCCAALTMTLGCVSLPALPSPAIAEIPLAPSGYPIAVSPPIVDVPLTPSASGSQGPIVSASRLDDRTPALTLVTSEGPYDDATESGPGYLAGRFVRPLLPAGRPSR